VQDNEVIVIAVMTTYSHTVGKSRTFVNIHTPTLLLALCIIVGVALRLFQLGSQSLWYDEVESLRYAADFALHDVHPPTYYGGLRLALSLGQSEFILRFPSVVAGVLSVVLVYVVAQKLFSTRIALLATLLTSTSPLLIWHSQDARMYSQAIFAGLLMVYTYLQAVQRADRLGWLGFLIALVLAIYTHLYTLLLIGALGLHFLWFHRSKFRAWLIVHVLMALAYLPWLIIMVGLPGKKIGTGEIGNLFTLPYTYFAFTTGYSLGPSLNELRARDLAVLLPYAPLLLPIVLVAGTLTIAGLYAVYRTSREKLALLLCWAVLPVIIAIIVPYFRSQMTFNVRYVVFAAPAFILILASGIAHLHKRRLGFLLLIVMLVYNLVAVYNYVFDERYAKEDTRAAAAYLDGQVKSGDKILTVTVGRAVNWYFQGSNPIISNVPAQPVTDLVESATQNTDTVWLVEARPWQTDPRRQVKALLDSRYPMTETTTFTGVTIYRYCIAQCSD
jgi:4-amino-4-deoxy-L-arabinose transferase-like glycosyltransferase